MEIRTVKTRVFLPPKDDLFSLIRESFSRLKLKEKSIIVITSKIVSIWQGRCIEPETVKDKDELIKKEAELYLDRDKVPGGYALFTIKNGLIVPTAGIDESNANGYFILWPEKPFSAAKKIYNFIKRNYQMNDFGIIITDSHSGPSRLGITGIAIAYYGFYPLKDYRGCPDIFGREMKISQVNIPDSLAAAAVFSMGECDEQTPIAIIEDIDAIQFKRSSPEKDDPLIVPMEEDIYAPFLKSVRWKKGGKYKKQNEN